MYINLDVVMRLVLIGLVVAGIGALVTLAMLFKNLMSTLNALTGTLDLLQRDLAKLEGPLTTVDELSTTVSEIQHSAKRAANSAIDTFQSSSEHLMRWVDQKMSISPEQKKDEKENSAQEKAQDAKPEEKSSFQPVQDESEKKPAPAPQPAENEIPAEKAAEDVDILGIKNREVDVIEIETVDSQGTVTEEIVTPVVPKETEASDTVPEITAEHSSGESEGKSDE